MSVENLKKDIIEQVKLAREGKVNYKHIYSNPEKTNNPPTSILAMFTTAFILFIISCEFFLLLILMQKRHN